MAEFFTLPAARVRPDTFGESIAKTIKLVASMRCPRHRKAPMVVVDDETYNYPGLRVTGCCREFVEAVEKKLE